ncbi:metal-dependent transcriptional regulator [Actinotalea sp. BY-33]|uniref:Manganese transport regulator n=1 Tax=Actinotalea soli TaxID=2819234 RepID=A0A939LNJ6_9CELL|nr:metal-dependent transcriptional regulator [Actinotalea soli]MBO1751707.1 metal-dependent transcriptional regulator [Actinotalea soli]
MSVAELSSSAQNYVKIIWGLQEWSTADVTATMIAERAGVRLSTVSDAVRRLADQGLVEHTRYGAVTLTDLGRSHALAMVRRHRLIEAFLVNVLGYGWDEVHDEAEELEHAVSDLMVTRIDELLGFPTRDPHGDPIPAADGTVTIPDAVQLSRREPTGQVVVERISDADPGLLQYFSDTGVLVGATLELSAGEAYSEAVGVRPEGRDEVSLGPAAADAVWVSPVSP